MSSDDPIRAAAGPPERHQTARVPEAGAPAGEPEARWIRPPAREPVGRLAGRLTAALLLAASFLLAVEVTLSLRWRMRLDYPLLQYAAYLMAEHGRFPYRDLFETSMPGTFLVHSWIGRLFGYGDLGFRLADLAWLGALSAVTWALLRRFGARVAWAGILLFGLSYLGFGPRMGLQRDYLGVLPIALAALVSLQERLPRPVRGLLAGLLFGLAATVKPHLAIGLPVVLAGLVREARPPAGPGAAGGRREAGVLAAAAAGLALPVAAACLWVAAHGAWREFREMVWEYLPLHLHLSRDHVTIAGAERARYLLDGFRRLGGHALWLFPGLIGLFRVLTREQAGRAPRRRAVLLGCLTLGYAVYPVLAGQFFEYHWMPFLFFAVMLAALTLAPEGVARSRTVPAPLGVAALALAAGLSLGLPPDFSRQLRGLPPWSPVAGRVDEIAGFLRETLRPGDRVQPLDWTGGAVHGMLEARAELATRFLYDYHLYHHVSDPFIQKLRGRFLEELRAARPRFVVQVSTYKPWVSGEDTTRFFRELWDILEQDYRIVFEGDGYVIQERITT